MNDTFFIKAYKFTVFEILRIFCVIIYCVSALYLHVESTDSMILFIRTLEFIERRRAKPLALFNKMSK